jgi:hypothetical protein
MQQPTVRSEVRIAAWIREFLFSETGHTECGVHPASYWMGYRDYSLEIKRPWCGLDHSHPATSFYSTGTTLLSLTAANYVRSCELPVLHACSEHRLLFKIWTALLQVFFACGMQGIRFNATICPQFSISITHNINITAVTNSELGRQKHHLMQKYYNIGVSSPLIIKSPLRWNWKWMWNKLVVVCLKKLHFNRFERKRPCKFHTWQ